MTRHRCPGLCSSFISDQSTRSEDEEQLLKSMAEYLAGAWVPMVAEMFRQQKSVLQEHCDSRDTTIASQLISELISVDSEDLPHCCATAMVDGRKVSVKEAFRSVLSWASYMLLADTTPFAPALIAIARAVY
eukprot:3069206-Rhodomonas_salina.1